ncbi:MAG: fasciclin domain-containing protein [Parachlamydiaceae bacterium]
MKKFRLLFSIFFTSIFSSEENPFLRERHVLTVLDVMTLDPCFSNFITALNVANLTELLENKNQFTIFAPTNAALDNLPSGTWKDLLKPDNFQKLQNFIKNHIVAAKITMNDFKNEYLTTINGKKLGVNRNDSLVTVNGVPIVLPDKQSINGVVHGINQAFMP